MGFSKIADQLRGARRIGLFVMVALAAALCMLGLNGGGSTQTGATELETRMEQALSAIKGAGDVRVLINEAADGSVTGVLVVAEGADDIGVRLMLESAVHATLDVDISRIEIVGMEGSG